MLPIVAIIFLIITICLLIFDIFFTSALLTIFLCISAVCAFFSLIYFFRTMLDRKRVFYFSKAMAKVDRKNPKYETLFIIYDYLNDEENNLKVVQNAMEEVYFFPTKVIKNPEKVKKKQLYNLLIEYYLSLSLKKLKVTFLWDYNNSFFTWKTIFISTFIGIAGIVGLLISYHFIPEPNDVLYTSLYFVFGALLLPFIAKFFDHFI